MVVTNLQVGLCTVRTLLFELQIVPAKTNSIYELHDGVYTYYQSAVSRRYFSHNFRIFRFLISRNTHHDQVKVVHLMVIIEDGLFNLLGGRQARQTTVRAGSAQNMILYSLSSTPPRGRRPRKSFLPGPPGSRASCRVAGSVLPANQSARGMSGVSGVSIYLYVLYSFSCYLA